MNFVILTISIILASALVGTAFAQSTSVEKEFTQAEIDDMKQKAVIIYMHEGTFTIEFFPEDAPNTVYNFLKLVESGYYDGIVFHRIIPGFMIQAGDPNTKGSDSDQALWGTGGPGYSIKQEFNTIMHKEGIVSMARSHHPDSAGSQFFIVHQNSPALDGKYTAFGRLVPGLPQGLNAIAELETDDRDRPLDVYKATIQKAGVIESFSSPFGEPEKNISIIKNLRTAGGEVRVYSNEQNKVTFDIPYRWDIIEGTGVNLDIQMKPSLQEHNAQQLIQQTGFEPLVLVRTEPRTDTEIANDLLSTGFFSIAGGDDPKVLSNYIFENEAGQQAHLMITTQNVGTSMEQNQFKIIQMHFNDSETNYAIIHVNLAEWFRYEVNSFVQTADNFEIMIDGRMQPLEFDESPVFQQLIKDSKVKPEPESLPPVRIDGGCLIATATFGSELAPQVQFLREIRDNTVLQTESGSVFMTGFNQFYYSFSPTVADYERENVIFKEAVKLTLTPLLASLTLLQYTDIDSEHEMLVYGMGLILLNIGMYFIAPAVLITKIRSFYKLQ